VKCPRCGSASRVLDTRHDESVLVNRRRRRCEAPTCRHTFTTMEVGPGAYDVTTARVAAGAARRRWAMRERDRQIASELHRGWEPLAARFELSRTAVYYAARRGRDSMKVKR
jgi:hypothetical protein